MQDLKCSKKQDYKMRLLLFLFFATPLVLKSQDWKNTELNFIKKLTYHRAKLLSGNSEEVLKLKGLIENWYEKESDREKIKNFIFQIQYSIRILDFNYKKFNKRAKKEYPDFQIAQEFTEEEFNIILHNSELIDLINSEVLKAKYPFQINSESIIFKELEFYDLKQNEHIGEVGAGNGIFSIFLSLLDKNLNLYVNEIGYTLPIYLKKTIYSGFAKDSSSKITLVKGKKKRTNFQASSLDKIIIRNSFHHFSKKEQMLADIKSVLKSDGVLFLNEPWKTKTGCEKRLDKSEIKSILQQNGFKLEKEMEMEGVFLLMYRPI